jgi:hypothetical protein
VLRTWPQPVPCSLNLGGLGVRMPPRGKVTALRFGQLRLA